MSTDDTRDEPTRPMTPVPGPDDAPTERTQPLPAADPAAPATGTAPAGTAPTDVPTDAAATAAPAPPEPARLRVSTVVWGLVVALVGVGLLAWSAGARIDVQLAVIVLLAVAGVALLVGSAVTASRRARR